MINVYNNWSKVVPASLPGYWYSPLYHQCTPAAKNTKNINLLQNKLLFKKSSPYLDRLAIGQVNLVLTVVSLFEVASICMK